MVSATARRQQVAYAYRRGLSGRRACRLLGVARSALHYESRKALVDSPVLSRLTAPGGAVPALRIPADSNLPRT